MNLIDLAKQLGEEIQNDELYIKVRMAEQKLETDTEFQNIMSEFNKEKNELNEEMMKETTDKEKIEKLNISIKDKYEKINKNENMVAYRNAQTDFMDVINKINEIILKSAQGKDPYSENEFECGGSCAGCSGCY